MTTTQISRQDNRTPIYYIGLVREGRKLIIQAKESIDDLSCEITDYLGARQVSKASLEANKGILLEGFKALPKYRNCDIVVVEEPEEEYKRPEVTKYVQIAYLERMQRAMMKFNEAMHDLERAWQRDTSYDLDMNDFLAEQYPFNFSFDDLVIEADIWYQKGWTALNRKIKVLQGYPHDKVYGVAPEEPPQVGDKAIEYLAMNQLIRKRNKELTEMLDVLKGFFKPQYWLIVVWADVEPELHGPFTSESERDANAKELRRKEGEENGYYRLDINGVTPSVNTFSGAFFEDEEEAGVGEPPAPYYTPEQAEGKWICAYDTMCGGWDCVRHSGSDNDGLPVLYNSKEEVEADDFFDGDDDFAIPATEFIEGRKAIFGGNGLHITGTPIVQGYKIEGGTTIKA